MNRGKKNQTVKLQILICLCGLQAVDVRGCKGVGLYLVCRDFFLKVVTQVFCGYARGAPVGLSS